MTGAAAFLLGGSGDPRPGRAGRARRPSIGVIVGVDSAGLDRVNGLHLRTTDQGTLAFTLGDLENGAEFPPGHLVEHQATAQPVRVWYRTEGGERVAVRLEDAPEPSPPAVSRRRVMTGRIASSSAGVIVSSYEPWTTPFRSTAKIHGSESRPHSFGDVRRLELAVRVEDRLELAVDDPRAGTARR